MILSRYYKLLVCALSLLPAVAEATTFGTIPRTQVIGAPSAVNDTNVTLTLGGTPTDALLKPVTFTLGWTGTLAAGRLNANVVQSVVNDTNVTGSITAQALTLGWSGTLAAARLNGNVVQSVTNDTNITGSIATQNLTLGWTGTLAAGRLNSNVVQGVTNDTNVTGSIATQNLTLGWAGTLAVGRGGTGAATAAANTVFGNNTGSTAAPGFQTLVDAQIPDILTITKASNLTTNGILQTISGDGTLSPISYFTDTGFHHLNYSDTDTGSIDMKIENINTTSTGASAGVIFSNGFGGGTIAGISKTGQGATIIGTNAGDFYLHPGSIGRLNFYGENQTLTTATSLKWDNIVIPANTLTLSGTTAITTATGLNKFTVNAPTYTDPSAVTVTNAATLFISGAPIAAGSVTITNPYSVWVDGGLLRADGGLVFGATAPATGRFVQSTAGVSYGDSGYAFPTVAGTINYTLTSDGSNIVSYPKLITNSSTGGTSGYATDTYLSGSACPVAAGDWKAKGQYRCIFDMVKTAAGTATPIITVRMGTAGTTADAAVFTLTLGAGTAVADTGRFEVDVTLRSVGATANIGGVASVWHHLAATGLTTTGASGFGQVVNANASFNTTTATTIGVSFNGGTSFSGTNVMIQSELKQ